MVEEGRERDEGEGDERSRVKSCHGQQPGLLGSWDRYLKKLPRAVNVKQTIFTDFPGYTIKHPKEAIHESTSHHILYTPPA